MTFHPLRQLRRVLIIVNPEQIRTLMNAHHCDAMEATTCRELPSLGRLEEYAVFTLQHLGPSGPNSDYCTTSASTLHIPGTITWNLLPWIFIRKIAPATPSSFAMDRSLSDLLREHRPHWTEGQEFGILLPNEIRAFDNPKQPYMMRLSCHEALSNPNMPP